METNLKRNEFAWLESMGLSGMDMINLYCEKILEAMKIEDLSLLDLALCAARFKTIAQLFQDTLARTQDEIKEEIRADKKGKKQPKTKE